MPVTRNSRYGILVLGFLLLLGGAEAQEKKEKEPAYRFTIETEIKRTPVKNQARTGTCWCFATVSFLESEILRKGKEEVDLSEMFIVRNVYPRKAEKYVRLHGNATFGQGGQAHDVFDQIRLTGLVPESVYPGMRIEENFHNHGEMTSVLKAMLDAVVKRPGSRVTPRWKEAFEAVLDVYLGPVPRTFEHRGKTFSPVVFASEYLDLNPDDYIEITSLSGHPWYGRCMLEVPDNWSFDAGYYNVPVEDLEKIADHALTNGYSLVWDGDVSERDFSTRETGWAVVPRKDWEDKTQAEREEKMTAPVEEREVTQEIRQKMFDDMTTTDDHLMHIVGIARDQNGTKFYLTKNSGGTERKNEGYVYLSRSYFLLKGLAIGLHRNALPGDIRQKLKLR